MIDIVIGSNFGDESKGTIVAKIASKNKGATLNILTNGGSQRAHSIVHNGTSYTFKHFGSGSVYKADSYYQKSFILNPIQFSIENNNLKEFGISAKRHYDCLWSTPWDMLANMIKEDARGEKRHGSCGCGIWETIKRSKKINMPFDEFMALDIEKKKEYLTSIKSYYHHIDDLITKDWIDIWNSEGLYNAFLISCSEFYNSCKSIKDTEERLFLNSYPNIIFENGQGLLLNDPGWNKIGATPSKTGLDEIIPMLSLINDKNINIHYVTRPYLTRHGKDLSFEEVTRNTLSSSVMEDRTNVYNEYQENFKFGFLDIEKLKIRIEEDYKKLNLNSNLILELTHCDEMDREAEFKKYFNNVSITDKADV